MNKPLLASFKWRHFEPEIIVCVLRWYLRFSLSYRDVEELLMERGFPADHTTFRGCEEITPSGSRGI
jgi:IS6 family transposase